MSDWRTMKIEEIEYSQEEHKVRLWLTSGGYKGKYGDYAEDRVTVVLTVEEQP